MSTECSWVKVSVAFDKYKYERTFCFIRFMNYLPGNSQVLKFVHPCDSLEPVIKVMFAYFEILEPLDLIFCGISEHVTHTIMS